MSDALVVQNAITPLELIQGALSSGTSPEVIRELVTLQQSMERFNWERQERQGKIDFDNALNRCQQKIGRIAPNRTRENNIGWADYLQLDRAIRPVYLEEEFSIGFSEEPHPDTSRLRMKATLSRGGIAREYSADISRVPANNKMSQVDADAGAKSRVKRYLILDIFNIAIGIDADENKGIPAQKVGQMSEPDFVTAKDHIENAANVPDLKKFYMVACKKADAANDAQALLLFRRMYDKRQEEINAGA